MANDHKEKKKEKTKTKSFITFKELWQQRIDPCSSRSRLEPKNEKVHVELKKFENVLTTFKLLMTEIRAMPASI